MTDRTMQALMYLMLLILPLSALLSQRLPLGKTIRMALIWLVIFAIGLLLVSLFMPKGLYR